MPDFKEYTLLNAAAPRAITSSTDATPIVVKSAAVHGLTTGDRVTIMGHTTNVAANGTWTITVVDTDDFSLDGSVGSGAGAGASGVFAKQNAVAFAQDFEKAIFSIDTDGGGDAAFTIKLAGSDQETPPDFAEAQSVTNQYDYIDVIDLQSGSSIDGDTGFVVSSADNHVRYEANTGGQRWLAAVPTAGTAGEVTVKVRLYNYN